MFEKLFYPAGQILSLKPGITSGLKRLAINNLRDLLFYRPISYQVKNIAPDLSRLQHGQLIQAEVIIEEISVPQRKNLPIKILARNDTGSILLVFFNKIPPFIFNRLKIGSKHKIAGKVQFFDYYFHITHPEFILNQQSASSLEPVYPLTYGIVNRQLYGYILEALAIIEKINRELAGELKAEKLLEEGSKEIEEYLAELINNLKTLHLKDYCPPSPLNVEQKWEECIRNLAEKELFANQVFLAKLRKQKKQKNGHIIPKAALIQQIILSKLGFELTQGQIKVIAEIEQDQQKPGQMMRLLQGDVGAGKTLVALMTMLNVAHANSQSALMAPTDLLANQHYQFFSRALEGRQFKCALLTGKTSSRERKAIAEQLENGEISILIGTHALFQERVNFKNLGYIVIDEQHKFGVGQRLSLINKASHPDVLVMTATPIPRSLTLTMFGDMDVSRLTSKPKDRLPIITKVVSHSRIEEVILAIDSRIKMDEKIYWICPLIDPAEVQEDLKYTDIHSRYLSLAELYGTQVAVVHGKMPSSQKEEVMQKFKGGEFKILIATTVIEVGIDVPDATLMVIENAEKFGLSQLHQLRGRVGRGLLQSYCILIYNSQRLSAIGRKRLEIMKTSNDGFYLAEQDLILRGSGEISGTKQSGEPEFFFADLAKDLETLVKANRQAEDTIISPFIDFQIKLFSKNSEDLAGSG